MTQTVRASLRATGQIGVLAAVVHLLVSTVDGLIGQMTYIGVLPDEGRQLLLLFNADAAVLIAVGGFAFWASTRLDSHPGHRRTAIIASWLGVGIGAMQIALRCSALPPMSQALLWMLLAKVTAEMFLPIGACACLAISYLGPPLGLGEPDAPRARSPWIQMLAGPAVCIDITIMWITGYAYLPEATALGALVVGLLYGLMRRRHPLPGAAGWAAATWPLIALVIPTYALNLAIAASTHNRLGRESIATAAALVILAGVVLVHLTNRRNRGLAPQGRELGISDGAGLTARTEEGGPRR